jgi:hypothetical protein
MPAGKRSPECAAACQSSLIYEKKYSHYASANPAWGAIENKHIEYRNEENPSRAGKQDCHGKCS